MKEAPLDYGIGIYHEGVFRFAVRQGRRHIGTRRTFWGAMRLARRAAGGE
jgi:hypothetical protein